MHPQATPGWLPMDDGIALRTHAWPHAGAGPSRGTVLIVHGLGEHAARYAHVAAQLNAWGFDVRAYDQYAHGESPGRRGTLTSPDRLLTDLASVIDHLRGEAGAGTPLVLLGHSMGGAVAARFVERGLRPVDALVLSSPALASGMRGWQKALARVLANIAPGITIGNGLPIGRISHDAAEVAAYRNDPLCHDRVGGRMAMFIDGAGPAVIAAAPSWRVPTLLLYAGDDHLVDARGSRRFAEAAPRDIVATHEFARHYHELFNEADRAPVFETLHAWLDAHFPEATST